MPLANFAIMRLTSLNCCESPRKRGNCGNAGVAGAGLAALVLVSDAACTGSVIGVSATTGAAVPTSCTFNADFTKLRNCAKVTGF